MSELQQLEKLQKENKELKEKTKIFDCEHYWQISSIDNLGFFEPTAIIICTKCGEVKKKIVK